MYLCLPPKQPKLPSSPPQAASAFSDVPADHLFYEAVSWLADQGITRGCNPPRNDRFCPDQPVTRGQMAAFLVRALRLPKGDVVFADTKGHLFEADIAALAAAGITRGCNPPRNDRFCPDDVVTRGQMAAFLVRALRLPAGDATFSDTSGHVFEADIAALASAGITRGCNPPANDRFCPDEPATRGQMAAFLFRAIPGQPLAITSAALPAGQVGDAYSATLEASGGTPPYVWSADGLPSGLNIDQPSGVISGTPTEAGTFPVEFTVTDSRGTSVTETLNLVVREPAPGPDPGGEDDSAGGEDDPGNGEEPDIELEYSSLSSGGAHTCGLTASGAAYCWGSGRYGRLGNGDSDNRLVPTPVAGDLTFTAITAGNAHTCGLTTDGAEKFHGPILRYVTESDHVCHEIGPEASWSDFEAALGSDAARRRLVQRQNPTGRPMTDVVTPSALSDEDDQDAEHFRAAAENASRDADQLIAKLATAGLTVSVAVAGLVDDASVRGLGWAAARVTAGRGLRWKHPGPAGMWEAAPCCTARQIPPKWFSKLHKAIRSQSRGLRICGPE